MSAGRMLRAYAKSGLLAYRGKPIEAAPLPECFAVRKVCARFVELCRKLGLLTKANVAIDGGKFKAVNDRDKNFTRKQSGPAAQAG